MNKNDIPAVNRLLKKEYRAKKAPVVDLVQIQTRDPFKVLLTTILSARTRDETTSQAARRLFKVVNTPADLENISLSDLEKLIYPVGFYHIKARNLKKLPGALKKEFNGRLPDNVEDLCKLPGVGRKTANLVVAIAFDKPAVCVDVHVHRICNRLGLLSTTTPYETEMELRAILPRRYWKTWNSYIVSFGQTVCGPQRPDCKNCVIARYCDKIDVNPGRRSTKL